MADAPTLKRALVEQGGKVGSGQDEATPTKGVVYFGLATAVILVVGVFATAKWPDGVGLAGVATALGLIGIITFIAFYKDSGDIRTAIAAAVVLTYFAFITVTFNSEVRKVFTEAAGKQMLNNFNSFVKLVITTYIGGVSVEKAVEKIKAT